MKNVPKLEEPDTELVKTLMFFGMPRNCAKVIIYLNTVAEAGSKAIETATGISQPEVSIALKRLMCMEQVQVRHIKSEMNRPLSVYARTRPLTALAIIYETAMQTENQVKANHLAMFKTMAAAFANAPAVPVIATAPPEFESSMTSFMTHASETTPVTPIPTQPNN